MVNLQALNMLMVKLKKMLESGSPCIVNGSFAIAVGRSRIGPINS